MPIVEEPFSRVAVDLVGPLPATSRGHRWILTLIDCATRYPEGVPVKGIDTLEISEVLVNIFTRVGIPREILSECGTQFTSDVMKEVARLLSLRQLFTTPYHAMCNGLAERFNGTLKKMLCRMSAERPKDWDRYIPALLFAYRDVPQESLGFSPFEMLYGRMVRGPMSILREIWTGDNDEEMKTTYQHVLELRERLEDTCRIAHQELRKAQVTQKRYYDRKSRPRKLGVGDKVLILLPTDSNKLLMRWKGPFQILRKVCENDYALDINGREKTFHANMSQKYHERETTSMCSSINTQDVEADQPDKIEDTNDDFLRDELLHCPLEPKETWQDVTVSPSLTRGQQRQTCDLLSEYQDVLTDLPGKTNLVECGIDLTDDMPFRIKPYPVPYALCEEMKAEVEKMLEMGEPTKKR